MQDCLELGNTSLSVLGPLRALGAEPSKLGAVDDVKGASRRQNSVPADSDCSFIATQDFPQGFLLFFLKL